MAAKTITINGVGFAATVEVEDGESYAAAFAKAGLADAGDFDVTADGAEVEPSDEPQDGAQVTASPKAASLG